MEGEPGCVTKPFRRLRTGPFLSGIRLSKSDRRALTYGRGDESTETTVWRGKGRAASIRLTANLEFTVRENESSYRVVLMVQSGVKLHPHKRFNTPTSSKTRAKWPTTLRWAITDVPEVARALKERASSFLSNSKNDQAIRDNFSSKNSPRAEPQALTF